MTLCPAFSEPLLGVKPVTQLHGSHVVQLMLPQPELLRVNVVVPELELTSRIVGLADSIGVMLAAWVSVTVFGVPVAPGAETSIWQTRDEQSLFSL